MWQDGMPVNNLRNVILNDSWSEYKSNYLKSISIAVNECNVDGIEFDYEPTIGYVTEEEGIRYANFLFAMKTNLHPSKQIGANMGVWGLSQGSYPSMVRPWINANLSASIDYINMMSYHWPLGGDILPWIKDVVMYIEVWGFNPSKINIGIPYFNLNGTYNEPLWCNLSDECPNMNSCLNICNGIIVVSKEQNYQLYIKTRGFRGAFPWAANYDSLTSGNTLVEWVYKGMNN